jgi:hypothetical protein
MAGRALALTLARRDRLRVGIDDDLVAAILGQRGPLGPHEGLDPARRALRELAATRDALDRLEAALVRRARFAGSTWSEIAADLGVSRPTASRRHGHRDPTADGPTRRGR